MSGNVATALPHNNEGAGPGQEVREGFRACTAGGVLKEGARQRGAGVNAGEASEGLGVDTGEERRILKADDALCRQVPITASEALFTGTRGLPAIHSSISDMMGIGHVPTGSIRIPGRTGDGGPRR